LQTEGQCDYTHTGGSELSKMLMQHITYTVIHILCTRLKEEP